MMTNFKESTTEQRKMDGFWSLGLGLLAAVIYGLTLSRYIYPGESARLMAWYSGVEPLDLPLHPVWGSVVTWLSGINILSLPIRLNLLSTVCMVVSVVLLYRLMSFLIYHVIDEEYSVEYASRVATWAGAVSSIAFLFSVPVWQAATRLQYQSFDLMMALITASMLVSYSKHGWNFCLVLFAFLMGVGVVESVLFISLMPVFVVFLIYVLWRQKTLSLAKITWMGALSVIGLGLHYIVAKRFLDANVGVAIGFDNVMDVIVAVIKNQIQQLRSGLPRVGWLILVLMGVVPWIASLLAAFRALNNERSWSQYILHFILTIMTVLGLANVAISPWEILKPLGRLPVCSYLLIAMTTGYLVAYWYLLLYVKRVRVGHEIKVLTKQTGDWLGLLMTYPLVLFVGLAAVINIFPCVKGSGAFADRCATEILDRLNGRTWFVTDGTLDDHLRILARERGQELNLLCLQKDMNPIYLTSLAELVEKRDVFAPTEVQRMKSTLQLGVLPFIQDWFAMDKEIEKKVAVFGVPDFWYSAGMIPVPEYLFFSGVRKIESLKDEPLLENYKKFWRDMDQVLAANTSRNSDPTIRKRAHLRRHMGFVANNLGVLLEDLGQDPEAFEVYQYVHNTIDPQNISALFNLFEMARREVKVASPHKEKIERELKDFVNNLTQRYPLWSLSRYYGYVRAPAIFARLGWGWALSGQTGAALAGVDWDSAMESLFYQVSLIFMKNLCRIYIVVGLAHKQNAVS